MSYAADATSSAIFAIPDNNFCIGRFLLMFLKMLSALFCSFMYEKCPESLKYVKVLKVSRNHRQVLQIVAIVAEF